MARVFDYRKTLLILSGLSSAQMGLESTHHTLYGVISDASIVSYARTMPVQSSLFSWCG